MFLNEKTSEPLTRRAYYFSANRIFAALFLQGVAVACLLKWVPPPKPDDYINLRETIVPAVLMFITFACFFRVTVKGMNTE